MILKIGEHNIVTEKELGNVILISYYPKFRRHSNINVSIASAITAYSRMHMSQYLNTDKYNVYYIDTDGIVIDSKLPDNLVDSKKLGFMKLEAEISKFVGIAPKLYGVKTIDGQEYTKVKGFKQNVSLSQLESLLDVNSNPQLSLAQEKWFKKYSKWKYSSQRY